MCFSLFLIISHSVFLGVLCACVEICTDIQFNLLFDILYLFIKEVVVKVFFPTLFLYK